MNVWRELLLNTNAQATLSLSHKNQNFTLFFQTHSWNHNGGSMICAQSVELADKNGEKLSECHTGHIHVINGKWSHIYLYKWEISGDQKRCALRHPCPMRRLIVGLEPARLEVKILKPLCNDVLPRCLSNLIRTIQTMMSRRWNTMWDRRRHIRRHRNIPGYMSPVFRVSE